jgi:hypothetical protein
MLLGKNQESPLHDDRVHVALIPEGTFPARWVQRAYALSLGKPAVPSVVMIRSPVSRLIC